MGKIGEKLALGFGIPFGISIALYAGTAVMSQVCGYTLGSGISQDWLEKSDNVCQLFSSLSQLIGHITNLV